MFDLVVFVHRYDRTACLRTLPRDHVHCLLFFTVLCAVDRPLWVRSVTSSESAVLDRTLRVHHISHVICFVFEAESGFLVLVSELDSLERSIDLTHLVHDVDMFGLFVSEARQRFLVLSTEARLLGAAWLFTPDIELIKHVFLLVFSAAAHDPSVEPVPRLLVALLTGVRHLFLDPRHLVLC